MITNKKKPLAMQTGRGRGRNQLLHCEYLHLKGHIKEKCYKNIGYPADFVPKRRYGEGMKNPGSWQQNSGSGKPGGWNSAGKPDGWIREPAS